MTRIEDAVTAGTAITRRQMVAGLTALAGLALAFPADGRADQTPTCTVPMHRDEEFGSVIPEITVEDFNALGFKLGDSLDIRLGDDLVFEDVPYLNGYYIAPGSLLLCAYPGDTYAKFAINYGSLWDEAGVAEGTMATITLRQAGGHLDIVEVMGRVYSDKRSDYPSDEVFCNFRELCVGELAQGRVYRSASPVDDRHCRAALTDRLVEQVGIRFSLDLSDSEEAFSQMEQSEGFDSPYYAALHGEGLVATLNLKANYMGDDFKQALGSGLVGLIEHEGPYLVHCVEGKDRTGFVCALIGVLAGATRDEIVADYMVSFSNYYGVTPQTDAKAYCAFKSAGIDSMLSYLIGLADQPQGDEQASLRAGVERYLADAGLTADQVEQLRRAFLD